MLKRVGLIMDVDVVLEHVISISQERKLVKGGGTKGTKVEMWENNRKKFLKDYMGFNIAMNSNRYRLFKQKGTTCVCCGLEGKYFAIEQHSSANAEKYHFNLYGTNEEGEEVMITKDHILPKSKGGDNAMKNYQVMCIKCNNLKGSDLRFSITKLLKKYESWAQNLPFEALVDPKMTDDVILGMFLESIGLETIPIDTSKISAKKLNSDLFE